MCVKAAYTNAPHANKKVFYSRKLFFAAQQVLVNGEKPSASFFRLEILFCAFLWLYDNSFCIYSNIRTQTVADCQMCAWLATMRKQQASFYGNDCFILLDDLQETPHWSSLAPDVCEFFIFLGIHFVGAACVLVVAAHVVFIAFWKEQIFYLGPLCVESGVPGFFLTARKPRLSWGFVFCNSRCDAQSGVWKLFALQPRCKVKRDAVFSVYDEVIIMHEVYYT